MAKKRTEIPSKLAAELLVANRHTCCICREPRKHVQLHHIDGNPSNSTWANIAVLCNDCHSRVTGDEGLGRRFVPHEVKLYKKKWEEESNFSQSAKKLVVAFLSDVAKQQKKKRTRSSKPSIKKPRTPSNGPMVFVPEAAGITHSDAATRKVMVRLILLGSASWTAGKEISMEPDFTATIFPPGSGGYSFAKANAFRTAKVPKGMHAYFLGEQLLKREHQEVENCRSKVGVIFSGSIHVEGVGRVPIFPVTVLSGCFGGGGGFRNEPIELRAIKPQDRDWL